MILKGVYTALVTPFINGNIAIDDFKHLISHQINGGVDGVVVCGTTGESPVLTENEFCSLLRTAVEAANDKIKVFAGVGSCLTEHAVKKTKLAHDIGVDGMLAVTPYYTKPTQMGLCQYYSEIASATDKPIMLYSVPSRTGVEIGVDTAMKLHDKFSNIVAIKEASENCSRIEEITHQNNQDFFVFSGNDSMTLPFMSLGAVGVVSVMSNLQPREMSNMVRLAYASDFRNALSVYHSMLPTMSRLFIETNPLPVKFLLKQAGIITSDECRPPLGQLSASSKKSLMSLVA